MTIRAFTYFNWFLVTVGLLITVVAGLVAVFKLTFGWYSTRTWYWLAMFDLSQAATIFIILLLISLLYLAVLKIVFRETDARQQTTGAAVVLLMLVATMLLCAVSWIAPLFQTGILGYREHIESARLDGHVYHLHFFDSDPAEGYNAIYHLYECDSLDLLCQPIYSKFRTTGGIEPDIEQIRLVSDPDEDRIALEINGEIAFINQSDPY